MADQRIRARSGVVSLTPDRPVSLAAAPNPIEPSEGVKEELEGNVLVLNDDGDIVVIVSVDLLYPGLVDTELRRRFEWLPDEMIWVMASHTHRAPLTSDGKPGLGVFDFRYVSECVDLLESLIRDLIDQVQSADTAAEFRSGTGRANHSVHRRRKGFRLSRRKGLLRQVMMAPSDRGSRDETVSLIEVQNSAGEAVCLLWNYACHPVGDADSRLVGAHYPALVRDMLRERSETPRLPVLFLQGFSGDTRPSATRLTGLAMRWGMLRRGYGFRDMDSVTYQRWCAELGEVVVGIRDKVRRIPVTPVRSTVKSLPLDEMVNGAWTGARLQCQVLRLGTSVLFVGLNAEVVSEYASWLRDLVPSASVVIPVGCMGDTYGYLPTEMQVVAGGYESSGYCQAFGLSSVKLECEHHAKELIRGTLSSG